MDFLVRYDYTDLELRAKYREQHLAHLDQLKEQGLLLIAGPTADLSGGIIVMRAQTLRQVEAALAADPYADGGVRKNLVIEAFTPAIQAPGLNRESAR